MRACRRRVLTSVRACRRLVCVRDRHVCVFTNVRCIDLSCACARMRVVTSVHARRHLVCVCAVCVLSRACVRVDVSCACVTVMCVLSRACVALMSRVAEARALWNFGPFPAAISIKCILILISINIHILVSI